MEKDLAKLKKKLTKVKRLRNQLSIGGDDYWRAQKLNRRAADFLSSYIEDLEERKQVYEDFLGE